MSNDLGQSRGSDQQSAAVERIYREWERAWANDDLEAMIALYAPDAVLENPLVPYMLGIKNGVLRGRDQIRALLDKAAPRRPGRRTFHRPGYLTNGSLLMWEYPRETPDGEQMDFIEVMEIQNGLIQKHRVY